MLKKEHISGIVSNSEEWKTLRLSKLTSSLIFNICNPEGIGKAGMNYIRCKVGEEMTGISSEREIDNDDLRWGILYEPEAVNKFGLIMKLEFIIIQQFVCNGRFGSTPDGIIVLSVSPDGNEYQVETLEVKCPPTYDNYLQLYECETFRDLKKVSPKYYWQTLDQMLMCGATVGWFMAYHPNFKAGNHNILKIEKNYCELDKAGKKTFPIYEDMKLLSARKIEAEEKFIELRNKLILKGKI